MKIQKRNRGAFIVLVVLVLVLFNLVTDCSYTAERKDETIGSYYSNKYDNLFISLLNKNEFEIKAKIDSAFNQLFFSSNNTQRVYYPVKNDMAYIEDTGNKDVRTEGMSYGMMITVQLNKKREFDRLWKWSKTYM
ncbi:MAG: glycosyl hydrolase family 8, partial [Ignavibacteriaceae bacterium]